MRNGEIRGRSVQGIETSVDGQAIRISFRVVLSNLNTQRPASETCRGEKTCGAIYRETPTLRILHQPTKPTQHSNPFSRAAVATNPTTCDEAAALSKTIGEDTLVQFILVVNAGNPFIKNSGITRIKGRN